MSNIGATWVTCTAYIVLSTYNRKLLIQKEDIQKEDPLAGILINYRFYGKKIFMALFIPILGNKVLLNCSLDCSPQAKKEKPNELLWNLVALILSLVISS